MSKKALSKFLPTWRYRLCLRLVSPLLLTHLGWRACRDGGLRYLKERLGFFEHDIQERIHVHAASVGEIITVLPLIEKFQRLHPKVAFLITTNTPTGLATLQARLPANADSAYLPIDFAGATQRFVAKHNISGAWIVETEIWPWYFARAKQRNIPITLINARLSHKSRGVLANFFARTYAHALVDVLVLARSNDDAKRYVQRGAEQSHVTVIGNLKYAQAEKKPTAQTLLDRPYLLAASTHEDEEIKLAQAWLKSSVDQLLVIVPRHPERGVKLAHRLNALQQEISSHLPPVALRSNGDQPRDSNKLYLADTLGEMHHWYTHATAAFVGGSLIKRGGHNVLEPGRVATPTIVGPHTFNFAEEVSLLQTSQAILIANTADEVVQLMTKAVSDPRWAQGLGERAKTTINTQNDVLDYYIASLSETVSDNLQV